MWLGPVMSRSMFGPIGLNKPSDHLPNSLDVLDNVHGLVSRRLDGDISNMSPSSEHAPEALGTIDDDRAGVSESLGNGTEERRLVDGEVD